MRNLMVSALIFVASLSFAGTDSAKATHSKDHFKAIHVSDLAQWMSQNPTGVYVLDANNEKVRTKEGVIPGAHILSSYDKYSVDKELPPDHSTKLVFYCANTMCSASHAAANKAFHAGYKDVSVMVDGIQGWKKAGKSSDPYKKNS